MKKEVKRDFQYFAIILGFVGFIYWPVHKFDFLMGWDDQWFVTNHYTKNGFTWQNLSAIFTEFYYGQYAPINQIYYTLLYKFFGYAPGGYHLLSVLIHYINSILVYTLLKNVLKDISDIYIPNVSKTAFFAALIFAILPINVEPVSWIAASKVLIYSMFYLIALVSYRRYLKYGNPASYYITITLFLFSFGAKEQAVVLPLFLFALDYIYGRNLKDKWVWMEKIPILLLAVLLGIITLESQKVDGGESYTILQRVPLFFFTISEYFTKCISPINLSYLYPFPFQKTESVPIWMWIHVISFTIIILLLYPYRIKKVWLLCFSLFIIHVALVSNVISLARFSIVADRYSYISSIGICLFLALMFSKFSNNNYKTSVFVKITGGIYIIFLLWTSQSYVRVWRNTSTLKERLKKTIELRPDYEQYKK